MTEPSVNAAPPQAPPVVAVMVVHEPGDWLAESLAALARQDYPALQVLILVSGAEDDPTRRPVLDVIDTHAASHATSPVVRFLGENQGFAASCNRVLDLVEGDNGFFCFLHDDVALEPDAISRLVEELYRSNAGLVAPKLTYWDNPSMIQSVGTMVDRFGVELAIADDGELDQEQHDAVQDVFMVSSACMMIRADLFRTVGGFEASLVRHGADLDLCWRVHATGARVVIVPSARARHRESMTQQIEATPEGDVDIEYDTHAVRARTVAALTSGSQLPLLLWAMFVHAVVRMVTLIVTGRIARGIAEIRAVVTLPFHWADIRRRRHAVARYRVVSGAEVRALQIAGSAHVAGWLRARARRAGLAESELTSDRDSSNKGASTSGSTSRAALVLWGLLVTALVVGSRSLISDGVSSVGQIAPLGVGVRDLVSAAASGWWNAGFGHMAAAPTGLLLSAVGALAVLGDTDVFLTLAVVGLPFVGWLGAWRFASAIGTRSARIAGALAYAAVPLPYAAISAGRWGALLLYALCPWIMHVSRLIVGHVETNRIIVDVEGHRIEDADRDLYFDASPLQRRRWIASLVLLSAIALAFEPGYLIVAVIVSVSTAAVTWVHGAPMLRSLRWVTVMMGAVAGGVLLNLPWAATYLHRRWWEALTGAPVENGRDIGLLGLAQFDVGRFTLAPIALALYAAVVGSVLLVRGRRTPWALRGAMLVVVGLLVALLDDTAIIPAHLAEPAVMLIPVAVGISMCAAAMGASLVLDVRRGRFSWRQPLGVVVAAAFAVGVMPAAVNVVDGRWNQTDVSLVQLLRQLPDPQTDGGYRTLFIGDPRVLPGAPANLGWGIGWSVVNGHAPVAEDQWETPSTRATDNARVAMYGIVRGQTARAGRLLAPLAVRFVVVPIIDGAESTRDAPIAAPRGLVDALSRQLDLRRRYSSPDLVIFENAAWVPMRSMLTEQGAEASSSAGIASMITADLAGASPVFASPRPVVDVTDSLTAGTLHVSVPYSLSWKVRDANGVEVPVRPAFGLTNAYDISADGSYTLSYDTNVLHLLAVAVQCAVWVTLAWLAIARRRPQRPGRKAVALADPVMSPAIVLPTVSQLSAAEASQSMESSQ